MKETEVMETIEKLRKLPLETQWSEIEKYSIEDLEVLAIKAEQLKFEKLRSEKESFKILDDILFRRAIKTNKNFKWTNENKQKFLKVNDKFITVFEKAYDKAISAANELEERINKKDTLIKDYEIEIRIIPYMDDKFYEDDLGNAGIGFVLSEPKPKYSPINFSFGHTSYHHEKPIYIDKSFNWNIEYFGDIFKDNYICYEIHELLDTHKWSFIDIINIDEIRTEVEVIHFYYEGIETTGGAAMKIAIDMDNTIIDELGSTLRPGIINFLEKMSAKHELILWTNSKRIRAMEILEYFDIRKYFVKIISRENYDPEEKGSRKDIEKYNYDIIIDDDIEEIKYNKNKGKTGILVESYRKNKTMDKNELDEIIIKYKL